VVRWSSVSSSEFAEFIHLHRSRDPFVDLNAYGGAPRRRLQIYTIQVSYESTSVTDLHDRGPPDRRDSPSQLTSTTRDCCKITHHPNIHRTPLSRRHPLSIVIGHHPRDSPTSSQNIATSSLPRAIQSSTRLVRPRTSRDGLNSTRFIIEPSLDILINP
jgi:hypothetical protein